MIQKRIRIGAFALAMFAALVAPAFAQAPATTPTKPDPAVSGLIISADTTIPLVLRNTISTRTSYVGESIYCETIYPITVGNRIVIPVGSYVKGSVTQVVRPGRVKGRGQLGLRFDSVTLPNGATHSIRATLSSFGGNGKQGFKRSESKIEGESSKGQDAGTIAETSVVGAEVGTIAGAASGHVARGLGIGSAAGAAGGVISVLLSRGKEIVLPSGTNLELQLNSPLRFEAGELDPPSRYDEGPGMPRRAPGQGS